LITILTLEDDIALCRGIELALASPGRRFSLCHNIKEAKVALQDSSPDLFIIDINLPDGSGLDFCAELRRSGCGAPILMLTANDTEIDIVSGFQSGADDYVTKPFSLAVLRARIEALLRRGAHAQNSGADSAGASPAETADAGITTAETANAGATTGTPSEFTFDFEQARFEKRGEAVELSKTESRLLQALYAGGGRTVPRERLLAIVWPDGAEYIDENALSVAIRRLRAKLEDDPSSPAHIKTVHGIGYRWAADQ
jgi:DNA-binding response OmpR family regulator